MVMVTTSALMTIEHYLRTSFHPDADFVDGEIEERLLGEREHGRLQGLLFAWFLAREPQYHTFAIVEQRLRAAESRVRICDVVILGPGAPYEKVALTPPLICIEVLSPEDWLARAEKVLADYRAMGVRNIWLIDPIRRAAHFYDDRGLHLAPDNVLNVAGTNITLDVKTIFAQLDETNAHIEV